MMDNDRTQGKILCVSGPSGVGKGTVISKLMEKRQDFVLSISITTRAPRGEEKDGVDYYFCSTSEFQDLIVKKEILEFDIYSGEYYGTPVGPIRDFVRNKQNVILDITIAGALQVKKIFPEALMVFLLPPSMDALYDRLLKRDTETEDQIKARIKQAEIEILHVEKFEYAILNDKIEDTVAKLEAILIAEECKYYNQSAKFEQLFNLQNI
ncbi:MAG: guanylate kinase [Clostridiaceae bacterium]|nr:guanylate kinase [Clostridiaceae bacterium]